MKYLLIFFCILIVGLFTLQDLHVFSKTRYGEQYEYFQTETSQSLPRVLTGYLAESKVRYTLYKIPNYVKDLFKYNKDFSVIYNAKNKYTVIVFTPRNYTKENKNAFGPFYQKVTKLISMYPDSFNIIERNEFAKPKYLLRYDRTAYKDLKEYCGSFCIINPKDDTMFVFKHVSNSELGALEVLFQQYHFMLK
ncbi:hypothetical protein IJ472_00225 [bacterium]|nr:hypothetical protein [bacterium]